MPPAPSAPAPPKPGRKHGSDRPAKAAVEFVPPKSPEEVLERLGLPARTGQESPLPPLCPTAVTIPGAVSFPRMEEQVADYWDQIDAFRTQLRLTSGLPRFNFFDGPPFATGLPHHGHMLAGTIKDVVCRYWASNGFYVPRRFGWDTHGVPVEHEIDKALQVTGPKDVMERIGLARYNEECRSIVMRYSSEWRSTVRRLGRWIDFDNDYKTLTPQFMESVWWAFKRLHEKGLVYEGTKVMPCSTGCATPFSNFEAKLNYKEVQDPTVIASFEILPRGHAPEAPEHPLAAELAGCHFVAWTTTPWTLPSNLALCVNPDLEYIAARKVADSEGQGAAAGGAAGGAACASPDKVYVLAECLAATIFPPPKAVKGSKGGKADKADKSGKALGYEVLHRYKGSQLVGLHYKPLFDYFTDYSKKYDAHRVLADSYVTADSGVGVVHIAPFFGEDDYRVALAAGLIRKDGEVVCPVDETGHFTPEVRDWAGVYVKDADKQIIRNLKERGLLVQQAVCTHQYPYCWRSDTPLLYRAIPSWFVRVEQIRDRLIANNATAAWVPAAIQEKRFHNWLVNARDWAISRNRFWGCPIPIWRSADGEQVVVVGSIAELRALTGKEITDLHRHFIDDLEIPDPRNASLPAGAQPYPPLRRVEPVFDCWFESGSMPYAQIHYPFENSEAQVVPADFIAEGLDQTRGWFYTLLILSTALFDAAPAKHCIVNGMLLAADGQKMSKRLRNYTPPELLFDALGADPVRLYLTNSPAVHAEEVKFLDDGVLDALKSVSMPWLNCLRFFSQCALRYQEVRGEPFRTWAPEGLAAPQDFASFRAWEAAWDASLKGRVAHVMDRWILASLEDLVGVVHAAMAEYKIYNVLPRLLAFLQDLTNWYIRLNRDRLKGQGESADPLVDQEVALNVLFYVLFSLARLMAPYTPFTSEWLYLQLRPAFAPVAALLSAGEVPNFYKSVHFIPCPRFEEGTFSFPEDPHVLEKIDSLKKVIGLGRTARKEKCGVTSARVPLKTLLVVHSSQLKIDLLRQMEDYIRTELNVLEVRFAAGEQGYATTVIEPDYMAVRELYSDRRDEMGAMMRAIKAFCDPQRAAENAASVAELREKGRVAFEGVEITLQMCAVRLELVPKEGMAGQADEYGFLTMFSTEQSPELAILAVENEIFAHIQKMRKLAKLEFMNRADVVLSDVEAGADLISSAVVNFAPKVNGAVILCSEGGEGSGAPSKEAAAAGRMPLASGEMSLAMAQCKLTLYAAN